MLVPGPAKKVVIHLNDDTSSRHDFLYKEILALLSRSRRRPYATLLRPKGGFGSHHLMHMQRRRNRFRPPSMPVRIEAFIETAANVEALLAGSITNWSPTV